MYWLMDKTRETKISLYVTLVLFAIVVIFMVWSPRSSRRSATTAIKPR